MTADRLLVALGSVSALSSVAAGAFGAHALRTRLSADLLEVFETAARYQMYHALAIFVVVYAHGRWAGGTLAAGWLFVAGTVIFSGSLYALALTGTRWLGAVTPVGGVCFLAGWTVLAWSVLTARP
ncbi:MAG: DUF423 domain-containing protein [Gemmatimonadota bacterium]|nr:DUF423 domain-containing protein [Gemmatimonadota bacterium]MDH3479179.1 DUF423 domain-containing protein [Gemmatimonadota bacterium]MDH5548598.1 DUF423 domain-containing protein [Gemmatimonadota bacterium]